MNIALWVVQAILAAVFAGAGLVKLTRPLGDLATTVGEWVYDVPLPLIRFTAAAEVLGAVGLVLPLALGAAPALTPVSATGLLIVMVGAIVRHGRRGERRDAGTNVALAILLAYVVWGRFGS